ncbi:transmembrane protein 140 [Sceloporus undulatus]|uniref:transmembrane protein 140 n=1 Tax=Sceloporus undulatus TaxID=8520 RepID=UPI001C4B0397|nr:transmembrane protein 140 [Sceloporus undulatus]
MQLKLPKNIPKPSTEQQWQKYSPWIFYLSNLFLAIGYIALLFYALIWETGNIVNLPTKKIGFFNFCLWDQEAEKLDCFTFNNLEKMGINTVALILSRICIFITPVLCLFAATTVLQSLCFKDRDGWKLAHSLLAICGLLLPAGLALFLFYTKKWIQISDLDEVFVALVGAHVLLLLHLIIIALYLARFKDHFPERRLFPTRSLP